MSVLFGLAVCVASVFAMMRWRQDVGVFLKGFLPLGFFLAGLVAVIAGISRGLEKPPPENDERKKN